MIILENEHIRASFVAKGAELQYITGVHSDTQFLWSGDSKFWGKFSPVLFPIVGALKNDTYFFEGQSYQLPRHGFARDMVFDYQMINDHEVLFSLKQSEETKKIYPFDFQLGLRYRIFGASLCCTYQVFNPAATQLYFSIGGHPAFAAPINDQGKYSDYYLQFNNDEEITYHHIEKNLISSTTTTLALDEKKLPLTYSLFYNDALVFKDLKSDSISLMNTKNYNGLNFKFKDFPFFGIWAAPDANFVCLEPWCGIADAVNHNQELTQKEGIVCLAGGEHWERTWQVTCF